MKRNKTNKRVEVVLGLWRTRMKKKGKTCWIRGTIYVPSQPQFGLKPTKRFFDRPEQLNEKLESALKAAGAILHYG